MQLTISDQARRDIEDIYTYSYQKFGQQKARQYIRQIEQRIYQIRDNPKLSKNLNFIKQDLRCIIIFSHVIYYLAKPEELIILRVLHQNQDAIRHLWTTTISGNHFGAYCSHRTQYLRNADSG